MEFFNRYIVTKRFKGKAICGDLNLPFGTECFTKGETICCDKGVICSVKSQNAYDYFTLNNDGYGELRRRLIDSIFHALDRSKQSKESYDQKWEKVWDDKTCMKYKRADYDDYWLWNHAFYHAGIGELRYIAKLVGAKEVM